MLSLSQTAGCAIRAMVCLDGPGGTPLLVTAISRATEIPRPYLAKIVNQLSIRKLVLTKRGYKGGVTLARPSHEITLLEIANAVDGSEWLEKCILGLEECSDERACPLHEFWMPMRKEIERRLSLQTLEEIRRFEGEKSRGL